jgi:hypothetical protein
LRPYVPDWVEIVGFEKHQNDLPITPCLPVHHPDPATSTQMIKLAILANLKHTPAGKPIANLEQ